jgi:hypothetical protein
MRWERWAALAGFVYVALFVVAFSLGIEVGPSDREILEHYADSSARAREVVAFFCIAGAALAFLLFASGLRNLVARSEPEAGQLAAVAWAGAIGYAVLTLAGNAVSRAPAFAAMEDDFSLDPNTRRLFEDAGLLLLASGAIAAILLVAAISLAAVRYGVLPRWLGWAGFPMAALLATAVSFLGFLVLFLWVLAVSVTLALRRSALSPERPGRVRRPMSDCRPRGSASGQRRAKRAQ